MILNFEMLARHVHGYCMMTSHFCGFLQHVRCARALVFVNFFTAAFAVAIIRRFDSLGRTQAYPIIRRFDSLGRTQAYHTPSPPPTIRRCIAMRKRAVERRKFSQDGVKLIRPHRRVTSWEQTALLSLRKSSRILQYCQTVTSQTRNHSFSSISTHYQFSPNLGPWQASNWANACLTRRQILQITFKRNTT